MSNTIRLLVIPFSLGLLAGCASQPERDPNLKADYRKPADVAETRNTDLAVPPDLTLPNSSNNYDIPRLGAISASNSDKSPSTVATTPVLTLYRNARIERAGNARWLSVDASPEQIWPVLKAFWLDTGLKIEKENSDLGLIETNWDINRAKLPLGGLRGFLSSVGQNYSTEEYDKYRSRIERNANGGTDIFVSHRGMEEVYTSSSKEQTIWQPRPVNPELEAEMLGRLLIKLGMPSEDAKKLVTSVDSRSEEAELIEVDNQSQLKVKDNFDRAWRRVGLALDRSGLLVQDKDRSKGIYYVKSAVNSKKVDSPLLGKLAFWSDKPGVEANNEWQITLNPASPVIITVSDKAGKPVSTSEGKTLLAPIYEQLK